MIVEPPKQDVYILFCAMMYLVLKIFGISYTANDSVRDITGACHIPLEIQTPFYPECYLPKALRVC